MRDLVGFCNDYNAIGYGEAEIIELDNCFVIKLYNAGFSDNEELDEEFRAKYKICIVLDDHPIIIAKFSKLNLIFNYHVINFGNLEAWCDCYSKKDEFSYNLTIK